MTQMRSIEFILAKDPVTQSGGDMAISNLLMSLARQWAPVRYVALSNDGTVRGENRLLPKRPPSPPALLGRGLALRRSLVHVRFDTRELRAWLAQSDASRFVAEHSYMAESYLAAGRNDPLHVNTVVSESLVWRSTRGALGRMQSPLLRRDELRVARSATTVGTLGSSEAEYYRAHGVQEATWLNVTFPPLTPRPQRNLAKPRLVFLGDRRWPPNDEAARLLMRWWPDIAAGIPHAELLIVGRPNGEMTTPPGVIDVGFAPDLEALLGSARGMVAPIQTGGGVRVKILEAAARGLPVVSTTPGIGSLSDTFGIDAFDERDAFVDAARRLLLDEREAHAAGDEIYERNMEHWAADGPQASVGRWLRL